MTLPAHRYDQRKKKPNKPTQRTWLFDYDGTITGAPEQVSRLAHGLKALGDRIIVLTGNKGTRESLLDALAGFGFPFDDLVQYDDDGTNGVGRANFMKEFDAWGGFDNRVDRAPILCKVCPQFFVVAEPLDLSAHGTKKAAKQAAADLDS